MRLPPLSAGIVGLVVLLVPQNTLAQVVPDSTFGSKVTQSSDHAQLLITGGSPANSNLFHSFDRFSLNTGQTAIFAPDPTIANIITRITGNTISNIDGAIAVQGNANLSEPSLLTISVPIGGVGDVRQTAPITNLGTLSVGKDLSIVAGHVSSSGQINAGNRASINANSLTIDQGTLATKTGGIDLNAQDAIVLKSSQINSTVDSGTQTGGEINVRSRSLLLSDGATINTAIQPNAQGQSGNITLNVQGDVNIRGESRASGVVTASGITSTIAPNAQGIGGNIILNSGSLRMSGGANIFTVLGGTGNAGSIAITVRDDIQLEGAGNQQTRIGSAALAQGLGKGGDITLTAKTVSLADRAKIDTYTDGAAMGGSIQVTGRDRITIEGTGQVEPIWTRLLSTLLLSQNLTFEKGFVVDQGQVLFPISAVIFSTTKQTGVLAGSAIGKTGNIQLNAPNIAISNQALISANNWRIGDSGSIKLDASEGITVKDGYLFVSVLIGKGANLEIDTPNLRLDDSKIIAATGYATGGSLTLNVSKLLLLRNQSTIAARSYNDADGGNIYINGAFIVAKPSENSNIIANAFLGRGGNIQINALSMLGIQYRSVSTSQSEINASSKFGMSGEVKLNVLRPDPSTEVVKLPAEVVASSNQIVQTCSARSNSNSFVVTGRGGIAPDLAEMNRSTPVWVDSRSSESSEFVAKRDRIVEATGWIKNAAGQVVLVAETPNSPIPQIAACPSN